MLCTALIDNVTIGTSDSEIIKKLEAKITEPDTVLQQHMIIGIRNHEGAIYRAIGITGLTDYLNVIEQLTSVNMTDELKEATGPFQGYDAIFKP